MARINLLPWRQEERARKNKEFVTVAGLIAGLSVLLVLFALTFLGNLLSNQEAANQLIEDENTRLDKMLADIISLEEQRDAMLARMKVIQDLQGRRSVPVRIWDDIARAVPSTMYLLSLSREGDTITMTGMADNAGTVSQLVRSLDASPWLADSGIPMISSAIQEQNRTETESYYPETRYISFTVTTKVSADNTPEAIDAALPELQSTDVQTVPPPEAQPAEATPTEAANEQPAGGQ